MSEFFRYPSAGKTVRRARIHLHRCNFFCRSVAFGRRNGLLGEYGLHARGDLGLHGSGRCESRWQGSRGLDRIRRFRHFGYLLVSHLPDWDVGGLGFGRIQQADSLLEWADFRCGGQPHVRPLTSRDGRRDGEHFWISRPTNRSARSLGIPPVFGLVGAVMRTAQVLAAREGAAGFLRCKTRGPWISEGLDRLVRKPSFDDPDHHGLDRRVARLAERPRHRLGVALLVDRPAAERVLARLQAGSTAAQWALVSRMRPVLGNARRGRTRESASGPCRPAASSSAWGPGSRVASVHGAVRKYGSPSGRGVSLDSIDTCTFDSPEMPTWA